MDKLQLTGQNMDQVFNFKSVYLHAGHLCCYQVKLPNLKLKIWPKQLLGSFPFDVALSVATSAIGTKELQALSMTSLFTSKFGTCFKLYQKC
jgi:hypothetical protein